jgi:hypothetical protein
MEAGGLQIAVDAHGDVRLHDAPQRVDADEQPRRISPLHTISGASHREEIAPALTTSRAWREHRPFGAVVVNVHVEHVHVDEAAALEQVAHLGYRVDAIVPSVCAVPGELLVHVLAPVHAVQVLQAAGVGRGEQQVA